MLKRAEVLQRLAVPAKSSRGQMLFYELMSLDPFYLFSRKFGYGESEMPTFMDLARAWGDQQKMMGLVGKLKEEMGKEGMEFDDSGRILRRFEQTEEQFLEGAGQAFEFILTGLFEDDCKACRAAGCFSADLDALLERTTFDIAEAVLQSASEQEDAVWTPSVHDCWLGIVEREPLTLDGLEPCQPLAWWESFGGEGASFAASVNLSVVYDGPSSPFICLWDTDLRLIRYTALCESLVEEVRHAGGGGEITGEQFKQFLIARDLDFGEPEYAQVDAKIVVDVLFEREHEDGAADSTSSIFDALDPPTSDSAESTTDSPPDSKISSSPQLWRMGRLIDSRPAWRWEKPWMVMDINGWTHDDHLQQQEQQEGGEQEGESAGAMLEFSLSSDGDDTLRIQQQDIDNLQVILSRTQLHTAEVETLHELFHNVSDDGEKLTKRGFDLAIRELIPGESLSDEDKDFLSLALSNIFFAFDRTGEGEVDLAEFASGFSILGAGSKSDKLALSFQLFDADGDGLLDREEAAAYLRSFLTLLFALTVHASEMPAEDVYALIDRRALEIAADVVASSTDAHGAASFEEYSAWYNGGGNELIPWIELLDLKKWPLSSPAVAEGKGKEVQAQPQASLQASPPVTLSALLADTDTDTDGRRADATDADVDAAEAEGKGKGGDGGSTDDICR